MFLEKEKERFIKHMENQKKDFNTEITDLENLTSTFKQYSDVANYEEIAAMAKSYKARLDEAMDKAKTFNTRESMVEYEDVTDYSTIP